MPPKTTKIATAAAAAAEPVAPAPAAPPAEPPVAAKEIDLGGVPLRSAGASLHTHALIGT